MWWCAALPGLPSTVTGTGAAVSTQLSESVWDYRCPKEEPAGIGRFGTNQAVHLSSNPDRYGPALAVFKVTAVLDTTLAPPLTPAVTTPAPATTTTRSPTTATTTKTLQRLEYTFAGCWGDNDNGKTRRIGGRSDLFVFKDAGMVGDGFLACQQHALTAWNPPSRTPGYLAIWWQDTSVSHTSGQGSHGGQYTVTRGWWCAALDDVPDTCNASTTSRSRAKKLGTGLWTARCPHMTTGAGRHGTSYVQVQDSDGRMAMRFQPALAVYSIAPIYNTAAPPTTTPTPMITLETFAETSKPPDLLTTLAAATASASTPMATIAAAAHSANTTAVTNTSTKQATKATTTTATLAAVIPTKTTRTTPVTLTTPTATTTSGMNTSTTRVQPAAAGPTPTHAHAATAPQRIGSNTTTNSEDDPGETGGEDSTTSTGTYVAVATVVFLALAVCAGGAFLVWKRIPLQRGPRRESIAAFQLRQQAATTASAAPPAGSGVDLIPNVLYQHGGEPGGVDLVPNALYSSADHTAGVKLTPNVLYDSTGDDSAGYLSVATTPGPGGSQMATGAGGAPQYETADSIYDAASETYAIVETQLGGGASTRTTGTNVYAVPFFGGDASAAVPPTYENPHFGSGGSDTGDTGDTGGDCLQANTAYEAHVVADEQPEYTAPSATMAAGNAGRTSASADLYTVVAIASPDHTAHAPVMFGSTNPLYVPACSCAPVATNDRKGGALPMPIVLARACSPV